MEGRRVDFYILPTTEPHGRELLACKLAEKAYLQGLSVSIVTSSPSHSQKLDELLWTFRDGSFVPHELARTNQPLNSPVQISHEPASVPTDMLINLTHQAAEWCLAFGRVAEVVDQNPEHLPSSRERFRWYREQGVEPTTHKL